MANGPFEDVFPIENGDIPACYVSLPEGTNLTWMILQVGVLTSNGSKVVAGCRWRL